MYAKVDLLLDEKETIESSMQISVTGSDITITYFDKHSSVIVSDKISAFRFLEFSAKREMQATLKGTVTDRSFIFSNKNDKSTFIEILSEKVNLVPLPENPLCFKIEAKSQNGPGILGFVAGVVKNFSPASSAPKPIVRRPVDAFTYGTIVQAIPEIPNAKVIDEETAKNVDLSTIRFASDKVEEKAFPVIFDRLLLNKSAEDARSCYIPLMEQWGSITKHEWTHSTPLRVFVHGVESQIIATKCSELMRRLYFNLAMSLYTLYFGAVKYDETMWFEITTLVAAYIKKDNEAEGKFLTVKGEEIELLDAEIMIFWPLVELHKKMGAAKLSVSQESLKVKTMLESISCSTVQMLNDRDYNSLDFATKDAEILFTRWREPSLAVSTLASALASGNIPEMRQSMLCASIILLHEKLQEIPIEYPEVFSETFSLELRSLDGKLLLFNAEKMISTTHHSSPKK